MKTLNDYLCFYQNVHDDLCDLTEQLSLREDFRCVPDDVLPSIVGAVYLIERAICSMSFLSSN